MTTRTIDTDQSKSAILDRLMKYVIVPEDKTQCWIWTAAKHKRGFGLFAINLKGKTAGTMLPAARVLFWLTYGDFDPDLNVMRDKCDNPLCVNPTHMTLLDHGTVRKVKAKKLGVRMKASVGAGHYKATFTEDQVRYIRSSKLTTTELAAELNVSYNNIYNVKSGKTYKSIV